MSSSSRSLVVAAYVTICLVWGSTYLCIRFALQGFAPFIISSIRFVAVGAILYGVARWRGNRSPRAVEWGASALTGALFFLAGNGLVNLAEKSVSSSVTSVLVSTMPLWATVFARVFGERITPGEIAGIVLGLAGVVVLNLGGELRASRGGAVFALLAPMGWALGSVAGKRLPLPEGVLMRTATQMLCGGGLLFILSRAIGEPLPHAPPARAVLAVLYLAAFGSLVGFTAYTYLLEHTRPAIATSYAYVNPVVAVLLGVACAHEHFGPRSFVGAAIVLVAVAVVGRARMRRPIAADATKGTRAGEGVHPADVPGALDAAVASGTAQGSPRAPGAPPSKPPRPGLSDAT